MQNEDVLKSWYQSAEGRQFAKDLERELGRALDKSFGYYALQLGYSPVNLLDNSPVMHCFNGENKIGDFHCLTDHLPIDSASVDVLVLSHALELSADPYATLREAERILVAEGKLFILGITPFSPYGLYQRAFDEEFQRFTSMRVRDWLGVLGFECQTTHMLNRQPLNKHFKSPVLKVGMRGTNYLLGKVKGRGYLVEARKRVTRLTPLKQQWATPTRILRPVPVAKPSTRVAREKWPPK